ncbi:hypothetical protein LEL_08967 [Akanthomyces lecanii RCEF 1005]|uniref:Uncharacterized protein n=1 Tax=Akanthomyces lecanii RCEF 1005 TaxID=1081108 RepID=A0A162JP53_CORDF|nr:hypothetical protein LEL_08967 [Akanthomyces lecanii RCEF 1005]
MPLYEYKDSQGEEIRLAFGSAVDEATFGQILELDESTDPDFSLKVALEFFALAADAVQSMKIAVRPVLLLSMEAR